MQSTAAALRQAVSCIIRVTRGWLRIDHAAWFRTISDSAVGHAPSPSLTADDMFAVVKVRAG